jgi:hypothetical protein
MFELPSSIALLTDLMKLDLKYNQFTSIDTIDFVRMSQLTSLNVSIDCCDVAIVYVLDFLSFTTINWDRRWVAIGTMRRR